MRIFIEGPRSSRRFARALLLGLAISWAVPTIGLADDDIGSAKKGEHSILDKIDQLQKQLDDLRAELAAVRNQKAVATAAAPAAAVGASAVTTPSQAASPATQQPASTPAQPSMTSAKAAPYGPLLAPLAQEPGAPSILAASLPKPDETKPAESATTRAAGGVMSWPPSEQSLGPASQPDSASPLQAPGGPAASPAQTRSPRAGSTHGLTEKPEPFAFADFTWLTGNPRTKESPLETKVFTGELRVDVDYVHDFNHPKDNTISGSSEIFRSGEFQVTQFGIGGDFHYSHIRGRLMTQFGMYSQTTPRNDASPARGQWNLDNAYRYLSEAYGGYHLDKMNGINIDAGIFMSYVGLYSYYQFDNWAYQPSYVSSNTPWFFNGVRIQIFPSDKLKIEPWLVNGWQSYGKFNKAPGLGLQVLWRPTGSLSILANHYWGTDTLGLPDRKRIHSDDSIQYKYYDKPEKFLDKAAFTFTFDAGCEYGGGVSCRGGSDPSQNFLGFMAYNRFWFHKDLFGFTLGGGAITNPGRYLVLVPPINGATAFSGTPYFTANPGDKFRAWDASATFDYMPSQFVTFRLEYNHRAANVPYFAGPGGVTPPGGNVATASSLVPGWTPDLRKFERRFTIAFLLRL